MSPGTRVCFPGNVPNAKHGHPWIATLAAATIVVSGLLNGHWSITAVAAPLVLPIRKRSPAIPMAASRFAGRRFLACVTPRPSLAAADTVADAAADAVDRLVRAAVVEAASQGASDPSRGWMGSRYCRRRCFANTSPATDRMRPHFWHQCPAPAFRWSSWKTCPNRLRLSRSQSNTAQKQKQRAPNWCPLFLLLPMALSVVLRRWRSLRLRLGRRALRNRSRPLGQLLRETWDRLLCVGIHVARRIAGRHGSRRVTLIRSKHRIGRNIGTQIRAIGCRRF